MRRSPHLLPLQLLLAATLLLPASTARAGGVFRFPLFYEPSSLDPQKDSSASTVAVANQLFDGLVAFDHKMQVVPSLAESWKVSRDGREYVFTLRRGVRFHHGRELAAEDVASSLTRIFRADSPVTPARFLERIEGAAEFRQGKAPGVSGVRVLSPREVAIRLTEPYAPFLAALATAQTKIVPRELAEDPAAPLGKKPVGTGPFRFVGWDAAGITLEANPDHFRGPPSLDRVVFVSYPKGGNEAAFADFLQGRLEGCLLPPDADPVALRAQGHQVLLRPSLSLLFYGYNLKAAPFGNPDLRKALALAFDRESYAREVLRGLHFPASQILPPGMPGYTPDNALLRYDPQEAARLLARAGHPGGKGLPELVVASASHSPTAVRELEQFARDLGRLGVKARPRFVEDWNEFQKGLAQGEYPLFRYAWYAETPDPDNLLAALFETGSPVNFTAFSDPEADRLLDEARRTLDPLRRSALYRRAEAKVLDASPLIPLSFLASQAVFRSSVRGIDLSAIGFQDMNLREVSVGDTR